VRSADGTEIALYEYGDPAAPVLVCVHGCPDNATLWNPVAARLADHFRVITHDVRGAGASDHPRGRSAYRLERLEEDFTAVLDEVAPDQPVQVLIPLQTDVARWVTNLSVQVVRGGHWLPRNDPGLVARLTVQHTRRMAGWQV
jgi:hypothetical protein